MIYLIGTIHVLVCIFLILVVLLQQGKGADLSVFGGGSTMTAFGARGAATLLHKLTVVSFVLFILTTVSLAIMQNRGESGSVMRGAAPAAAAPFPGDTTAPVAPTDAAPVTETGLVPADGAGTTAATPAPTDSTPAEAPPAETP